MKQNHQTFRSWQHPFSGRSSLAYITLDLFGSWNVVKAGGSTKEITTLACRSQAEALHVFKGMNRRYLRQGYRPVFPRLT
jgi:hypothetical protein